MRATGKIFSFLLAAVMLVALAGCGGKKENKVIDDHDILGMSFTAPEEFKSVLRGDEKTTDGKLVSKSIGYTFSDDSSLTFAFTDADGKKLEDELGEMEVERKEYNGTELILYRSSKKTYMAFYQKDENVYGIQYQTANEETIEEEFDKVLQTVKFTDKKETTLNEIELDKITFNTEVDVPLYSVNTTQEENPDGTLVSKKIIWKYSNDSETFDYRFGIEEYVGSKLEDILKENKEYEDVTIGDITYKVEKGDEDADVYDHYNFYVQNGDNVYVIQNKGISNGWFVSRSEESKKAFQTFINTIKLK